MIKLYNTKTRVKEIFIPIDPENVRMYVCGPTVYDRAHLGNGRPVVVFDVLYRLLRHVYGPDHVTYVRNFTDVDDKINATALARQQAGDPRPLETLICERTEETIQWYHDDMDALGALRPSMREDRSEAGLRKAEPRATEYIDAMIAMIEDLIARKNDDGVAFAYVNEGHALFRVKAYKNYGALSGRSIDDMIAGARVEVAPYKEDPMDFVLWKPSSGDEPGWDSPWGRGRPGWHIECSAMSYELLGASFDIHGGGLDLQFPHHENEIAQSCCAHPQASFARVWMHNEMLQVEGKKMSKSLGNFFTVRDLLDQGYPGEVIRMVYLGTHYGKPMDWTREKAIEAEVKLFGYIEMIARYGDLDEAKLLEPKIAIVNALSDDLNTHEALRILGTLNGSSDANDLGRNIEFLGILSWAQLASKTLQYRRALEILAPLAIQIQKLREEAKVSKNFLHVDALKSAISEANVSVMMSKDEVVLRPELDFDVTKLEVLK
jgi:cysteinyl-tRNA synthetase